MSGTAIKAGEIVQASFDAIRADRLQFGVYLALMTIFGMALDMTEKLGWQVSIFFAYFILVIIGATKVTESVMLMQPGIDRVDVARNRFGAVFLATLAASLSLLAGLLILILPGLFIFVRWYVLIPAVLDLRGERTSAYAKSYGLTGRNAKSVTFVAMAVVAPTLIALIVPAASSTFQELQPLAMMLEDSSPPVSFALNFVTSAFNLFGWYSAAAAYNLFTADDESGLAQIFA